MLEEEGHHRGLEGEEGHHRGLEEGQEAWKGSSPRLGGEEGHHRGERGGGRSFCSKD